MALGALGDRPGEAPVPRLEAAAAPAAEPQPARTPARPRPSRPPIGEDGIMGGLPFGTAWLWLEPVGRNAASHPR